MRISIHQPNFFGYYPFFQKISESDVFVILENCQFEKNNFQNRFDIDGKWHTMSVESGIDLIKNKKYHKPYEDWEKIKRNLLWRKGLGVFDDCISSSLSDTNSGIIEKICGILEIKTKIVKDYETSLTKTERLVDICKTYGATDYLSGPSGKNYLDLELFKQANIAVSFFEPKDKRPILNVIT